MVTTPNQGSLFEEWFMSREDILAAALQLSMEDRAALVQELLMSMSPDDGLTAEEWEVAWAEEIRRRMERLDRGESSARPWREVLSEIRSGLKRTRPV